MHDHPDLLILSYSEAAMLLKHGLPAQIVALLSIHGHREHSIVADIAHSHVLKFDDLEMPDGDDPLREARMHQRRRAAAEYGLTITPPDEGHVREIVDFARATRNLHGTVLFQCFAGLSRSPAAALLCLAEWLGPGNENACVRRILELRPAAQPHRELVRLGDSILHRQGRLLAALDSIF